MARLIDADAFLENNKELADCDFIHPKYCDTLRDLVNNAPTVDVLEQIRDEIEQIEGNEFEVSDMQGNRYKYETITKTEVLQIIDKYKAQTE